MATIRKVGDWEFVKDDLMKVTTFINETIDFVSLWNTGSEAEEEIEMVNKMTDSEFIEYAESKTI